MKKYYETPELDVQMMLLRDRINAGNWAANVSINEDQDIEAGGDEWEDG